MKNNYDFSNGIRGKYYDLYQKGTNLVAIEPDIKKRFPDSESVDYALRAIIMAYKHPKEVKSKIIQ